MIQITHNNAPVARTIAQEHHDQQLKIAKNLLLDSYLPIGTIAEMCGMESQRRFNDVFKKKNRGHHPLKVPHPTPD